MPTVSPVRREIQLCYPFSEDRLFNRGRLHSTWTPPYLYHHKLNGERCRVLVEPERTLLFSSTGEFITTLPHINQQMSHFPPGQYDGELYVHGWTWAEIHSAVSTTTSIHPRAEFIQLHLFDWINHDQILANRIYHLSALYRTLASEGQIPDIKLIPPFITHTMPDIMALYNMSIDEGYEGFVLKDLNSLYIQKDPAYRSPYWMKFKPKQSDTYPILQFIETTSKDDTPMGMVGAFECIDPEGNIFKVGAGKLTHSQRKTLWDNRDKIMFSKPLLFIEYQTLSDSKKVPLFARAVKLINPLEAQDD